MKKVFLLIGILLIITLALVGCNAGTEPTDTQASTENTETQKQTDTDVSDNSDETAKTPCTFGDWQPSEDKIENCETARYFRICSDCGAKEWKDGGEHKYTTVTTPPTCQEKGYDTNTCSVCGTVTKTNETPVTGHSYGNEYLSDNTSHWQKCKSCESLSTKAEHSLNNDGICTVCDELIAPTAGVIYDVSADGTYAKVVGYEGTATRVRIADTYENLPVKNIYSFGQNKTVTEVIIPDGVTSIGDDAFDWCSSLTSITIPDSVTSIGEYAFFWCSSLTSITIPDSVTSIGAGAFFGCSGLTSITIPDSVTSIGNYAFKYCSGLTSITIPDSVTSIGAGAFFGCSGLTSITIPDSVTSIGSGAFEDCDSLTSITVEEGNTKYHSAGNCLIATKYKTLVVGCNNSIIPSDGSVTSIGAYAFEDCDSLTSITIPDSVTSIGYGAFFDCSGLTSVTIPDGVKSIESYAFSDCSRLTSITIPDSVTSIGACAFNNCSNLASVTIPDGVKSIESSTFFGCSSLTSITIPDSVTSIGNWAFDYCSKLTDVYYTGTEAEWNSINITRGNDKLTSATKHYNYVPQ